MTLPDIWSSIRIAWNPDNAPSDTAIENATRLLGMIKGAGKGGGPDWAGRGDWPTVCLNWTEAKVEIEVYDDMFQLCQFDPEDHASIRVIDYEATPDGMVDLVAALRFSDQLQPG
ncbi:MAG: hypothetical protein ACRBB0_04230 [Pelagimonas sp.]|uniref:hypothetical protein n=1 Tax=Pelagimonas sp. TaxID=2073170 RepID=UPI003D6B255D